MRIRELVAMKFAIENATPVLRFSSERWKEGNVRTARFPTRSGQAETGPTISQILRSRGRLGLAAYREVPDRRGARALPCWPSLIPGRPRRCSQDAQKLPEDAGTTGSKFPKGFQLSAGMLLTRRDAASES